MEGDDLLATLNVAFRLLKSYINFLVKCIINQIFNIKIKVEYDGSWGKVVLRLLLIWTYCEDRFLYYILIRN